MKKNHEKGDDHVTQSKKIRARSRWRTFQCMISRILIKSDDCAILEEFRTEFQCQFLVSNNHHVTQLKKSRDDELFNMVSRIPIQIRWLQNSSGILIRIPVSNDHVTQSKKIRGRSKWQTFQCTMVL